MPFDENKAVYDEIHGWSKLIHNSVWIITSFFIILNLTAIKIIVSESNGSFINHFNYPFWVSPFLGMFVFIILWAVPAFVVMTLMFTDEKVVELLKADLFKVEDLRRALISPWDNLKVNTLLTLKEILKTSRFSFGWIILAFSILFFIIWTWIFCCFVPTELKGKSMTLKEITPKYYKCGVSACPAIFEVAGKDKLVIVGSQVNPEEIGIARKVGKGEQAVMIDKEMLKQIFEK